MNVRQLEEFIGSGDQKVFHILTVTHLYGGITGTLIGAWLLQPLLGVWGFLLGGVLGLASTWKRSGRPLYGWALAYVRFAVRTLFGAGNVEVDAAQFYAAHRERSSPYMVMRADGSVVMVNRGSEVRNDPLDRLIIVPTPPNTPNSIRSSRTGARHDGGASELVPRIQSPLPTPTPAPAVPAEDTSRANASAGSTVPMPPSGSPGWTDGGSVNDRPQPLPGDPDGGISPRPSEADFAAWGLD